MIRKLFVLFVLFVYHGTAVASGMIDLQPPSPSITLVVFPIDKSLTTESKALSGNGSVDLKQMIWNKSTDYPRTGGSWSVGLAEPHPVSRSGSYITQGEF